MTQSLIIQQLHQLKLFGMAHALTEQDNQPPLQDLSFLERLALLLDRELLHRSNRRIANLLRQAKLRQQAIPEDIDYHHPRQLDKSAFSAFLSGDFIRHHHNLMITGPTGSGKSYLACAIGHQACRLGFSVRYIRLSRFFDELAIAHADGSYGKLSLLLLKTDLLILDDFALLPAFSSQQRLDFFNLIEDRHQLKSTLITSQLPIKHWYDYIGEPTTADAILDRLLQHAHRLELSGESMRKKNLDSS